MPLTTQVSALATRIATEFKSVRTSLATKFGNGDIVMPTNPFGGRAFYLNQIHNALYRATERWTVTGELRLKSDNSVVGSINQVNLARLFDGDYEGGLDVPLGQYAVVTVDFGGILPSYPYGDLIVSHYYNNQTESLGVRVYCNYEPQGVGWKTLTFTDVVRSSTQLIRKANNQFYNLSLIEFTFTSPDAGLAARVAQLDWKLDRPGSKEMPYVDKYKVNTLLSDLVWRSSGAEKARISAAGTAAFSGSASVDGTVLVKTNDSRLSDARTPTAHTHSTLERLPGEIQAYGGATAPAGWLLCNGAVISRTTYAALFAVVGTNFNVGGEAGTDFRLPDLRGRAPVGSGQGTGLTNRVLGASGGAETHVLGVAEMPSHNHGGLTGGQSADHTHGYTTGYSEFGGGHNWTIASSPVSRSFNVQGAWTSAGASVDHTHTVPAQGSGSGHNNMQPWQSVNYIIKT